MTAHMTLRQSQPPSQVVSLSWARGSHRMEEKPICGQPPDLCARPAGLAHPTGKDSQGTAWAPPRRQPGPLAGRGRRCWNRPGRSPFLAYSRTLDPAGSSLPLLPASPNPRRVSALPSTGPLLGGQADSSLWANRLFAYVPRPSPMGRGPQFRLRSRWGRRSGRFQLPQGRPPLTGTMIWNKVKFSQLPFP